MRTRSCLFVSKDRAAHNRSFLLAFQMVIVPVAICTICLCCGVFDGAKELLFTVKLKKLTTKCVNLTWEIFVQRLADRERLSAASKPRLQGNKNCYHLPITIGICKIFVTLFWQRDTLHTRPSVTLFIDFAGVWNMTGGHSEFWMLWYSLKVAFLCWGDDCVCWYCYGCDEDSFLQRIFNVVRRFYMFYCNILECCMFKAWLCGSCRLWTFRSVVSSACIS